MATVDRSQRTPGRAPTVIGLAMVATGLVVGIVATVMFVIPFVSMFTQPIRDVPGEHVIDLGSGDHDVYALVSVEGTAGVPSILSSDDIEITGPDGVTLDLEASSGRAEIDRDSSTYRAVATFEVREPGAHRLVVDSEQPGGIIVSKTIGNTFGDAAPWLVLAALAALVFVAGVVVAIVGWSRRRRARRSAQQAAFAAASPYADPSPHPEWAPGPGSRPPAPTDRPAPSAQPAPAAQLPPAGWYPDPERPGGYRYWTGTAWTSDTHDPGDAR